jgi:hypothetical protein
VLNDRGSAAGLVSDDPGDPEGPTGWRGALQVAADLTRNDPGVLRVADELYAAAHDLRTRQAVRAYAASTLPVFPAGSAHWLLRGMLERLDTTVDR